MGGTTPALHIELPDDPDLRAFVATLIADNASLKERIRELEKMCFGPSTEKKPGIFDLFQQGLLPFQAFLEAREKAKAAAESAKDATITVPEHERKKKGRRKEFPEHLPRQRVQHELTSQDRQCCGQSLRMIGWEEGQVLERIEFCYVVEHACEKGVCDKCGRIAVAERPARVFDRSLLGPNFLARLIYERFGNHMPYARLERKYADEGLDLARSVLCSSVMRCSELLTPVYQALRKDVLGAELVQSDDTEVVQRNGQCKGRKKVNLWAYRAEERGAFFEITDSRSRDGPRQTLAGFSGVLQCDGHDCFEGVGDDIKRVGCWAHARRKFVAALDSGDKLAEIPVALMAAIFAVEREVRDTCETPAERVRLRQSESAMLVDQLHDWIEQQRLEAPRGPKSHLMKAVNYALNQWKTLKHFLTDGRVFDITNNATERALRGPVVGRKNWLFFGNEEGARAGSILMSLVQSCKELRINPLLYLADVLSSLSTTPASEIGNLTPRGWKRRHAEEEVTNSVASIVAKFQTSTAD